LIDDHLAVQAIIRSYQVKYFTQLFKFLFWNNKKKENGKITELVQFSDIKEWNKSQLEITKNTSFKKPTQISYMALSFNTSHK
jgi:hypothetical protein